MYITRSLTLSPAPPAVVKIEARMMHRTTPAAPHPAEGMEAYPVTTRVNRPAYDDAACIARANATF